MTTLREIPALERSIRLVGTLATAAEAVGVTELADRIGIPKGVAHRYLSALEEAGWVESDGGRYRLGPELLGILSRSLRTRSLLGTAEPVLREVWREARETVTLSAYAALHRTYLWQLECPEEIHSHVEVEHSLPLHVGATGRDILSRLDGADHVEYRAAHPEFPWGEIERTLGQVRRLGYSVSEEERLPGVLSIAAPVTSAGGAVRSACSVRRSASADARRRFVRRRTAFLRHLAAEEGSLAGTAGLDRFLSGARDRRLSCGSARNRTERDPGRCGGHPRRQRA